jgi:type IV pilus assembly protein PilO
MPRNFDLSTIQWKDPRVVMRAILGLLLAANLVMAVVAFKPFGGSADDLRREQASLQQQLTGLKAQVARSKRLVEKVETARTAGDGFLQKYVTEKRVVTSTIQEELVTIAESSGVVYQPISFSLEPIEGSDTLSMMTINASCQGNYQALAKFLNLVDKSSRFLIIESLNATPLQAGDKLNVTLKVDTFIRQPPGDEMGPAPAGASAEPAGVGL